MTEPTAWIGGQLTSQAVPPDENPWIESAGASASYLRFRSLVRAYYREHYPLTPATRDDPRLNPGGGFVSWLCHEPTVAHAVLEAMLAFAVTSGSLLILRHAEPVAADTDRDRVRSVTIRDRDGAHVTLHADYFLDATELGDLLPLVGAEYVTGTESRRETGEPHAPPEALPQNVQAFTCCMAVGLDPAPGADHTIERPRGYERWRSYVPQLSPPYPGPLFSWTTTSPWDLAPREMPLFLANKWDLWHYRRLIDASLYPPNRRPHEVTLVNWPQNDYWLGNVIDAPPEVVAHHFDAARELSRSLLYWMQTEAPRHDGGVGYAELYPRPDITGGTDGLALAPYIRESRRIRARFTVTENHIGLEARGGPKMPPHGAAHLDAATLPHAEQFRDSVGIGCYRIDLHPTTGGDNFLDLATLPFQIPLGALVPVRLRNLLPACKNLGVTHITNGCYRLHPVEWNIGESAGALAAFCIDRRVDPATVYEDPASVAEFQQLLLRLGVRLAWEQHTPV